MARYISGIPAFGEITGKELLFSHSLKSSSDIPNPSGKNGADGANVIHHSTKGVKGTETGTDNDQRYLWIGPTPAAGAWTPNDVSMALRRGFTIGIEIEKSAFDGSIGDSPGTGSKSPFQFRGGVNTPLLRIGRPATTGLTVAEGTFSTVETNATSQTAYFSKYAYDKEYIQFTWDYKQGRIRAFADGYQFGNYPLSAISLTNFDRLYIGGIGSTVNSTPPGFPFWIRNFWGMNRRMILPLNPLWDNITIAGDSWAALGDYHITCPRADAAHPGGNADAGINPMLERLMARDGYFTSDIHNSGRIGARLDSAFPAAPFIEQLNGSPSSVIWDALRSRGKVLVILIGVNDAISETTVVETTLRVSLKAALDAARTGGFENLFLCTIPDLSGTTSGTNSASVITTRVNAINAMYRSVAGERNDTVIVELGEAVGAYSFDKYKLSPQNEHLNEEYNVVAAKAIYQSIKTNYLMDL